MGRPPTDRPVGPSGTPGRRHGLGDTMSGTSGGTPTKNQYGTTARHQMEERHLILRGGSLDGRSWTGVVAVGDRTFCGDGAWTTSGVYVVTAELGTDGEGREANVAVPAFA